MFIRGGIIRVQPIIPVNFRIKWILWNVYVHFDCASSRKTDAAVEANGISPVNSHAIALVKCPCAFRLCRLAFSCKFLHQMALMACPCAFRPRRLAQNEASHTDILPRDLLQGACREILPRRPLMEVLFRDLAKRPLAEILPGDLLQRSCTETWWSKQRSCSEIFYRELEQRSYLRSLRSLIERSLQESCQKTSYRDLVQRHCIEMCCRDLAQRCLTYILPRELF